MGYFFHHPDYNIAIGKALAKINFLDGSGREKFFFLKKNICGRRHKYQEI